MLRSQKEIELHVKGVEKRGTRLKTENSGYILTCFDQLKSEKLAELLRVKRYDLKNMV